ncbi:hypothetical protein QJQ45_002931 [Haematococcus lacustris]|nr:hypothetical protein QJQ45_002931 [Haematococcus lacustris]
MRVEGFLIENSLWDLVETGVTALPPAPESSASADARAAYAATQTAHRAELVSDAKAKALIKRYVSNPYLQIVHDAASAKEAWDNLEREFTQVSVARQTQLQQQLSMMRMQPGETVANFFSRIHQLKSDLEACNCSISESNIVLTVIANLTSDYKPSAQQLRYEQTGPTGLLLSRVKRVMQFREADLLLEQQQEQQFSSPSSLFAFSSSSSRGAGSSGGGGAATDDGASFHFEDNQCIIRDTRLKVKARKIRSSYILAAVPLPDDPYTYDMQQPHLHSYSAAATQTDASMTDVPNAAVPDAVHPTPTEFSTTSAQPRLTEPVDTGNKTSQAHIEQLDP